MTVFDLKYRSKFTNLNINICNSSYRWLNGFLINRVNSVLTSDDYKKTLYVKSTQWITINFIANGWMNKSEFYVTIKMGVLKRILLIEQKRFQILLKLQLTDVSVFDITLPDVETINQSFRTLLQSGSSLAKLGWTM